MLTLSEKTTLLSLVDAGFSVAEISQRTGKSLGTVYKYKKTYKSAPQADLKDFSVSPKILPVKDFVDLQIKEGVHNSRKIYQVAQQRGYKGSYALLNAYVRNHSKKEKFYKRSTHVELGPGEQAQVDWGSFGSIEINGREERLYAFVYVLSYSRAMYVEFVVRQNQQTFQGCHIHAFDKLGIPKAIRYDNVKTVVLNREKLVDGSKRIHYNPVFLDFAQYYGFHPEVCPPYWPRSKGRVESGVKYLRNNFMSGEVFQKTFTTLEELNEKVREWLENVAQQRVHRSTEEKPADRWRREKEHLRFSENLPAYNLSPFQERHSTKDGGVSYKTNLYSVPSKFSQKKLLVREKQQHGLPFLEIYYQGLLVATHQISPERGKWIIDDRHELEEDYKTDRGSLQAAGKEKLDQKWDTAVPTRDLSYYDAALNF